jgi:CheY-like chemotaxis protein
MGGLMMPLKLLVVEDDPASLELMTEVFTSLKSEVSAVSDSERAAGMVNQERFDGIFLDLEMPNLNGFELAGIIRKSAWNRSTPIVIVTGGDERRTMQEAFAIGATFFLQKPVDRAKLSILFRTVSGGMFENRRKYTRVPLQTEVMCSVNSRTICGIIWNLSQGGMQVEAGGLLSRIRKYIAESAKNSEKTVHSPAIAARAVGLTPRRLMRRSIYIGPHFEQPLELFHK